MNHHPHLALSAPELEAAVHAINGGLRFARFANGKRQLAKRALLKLELSLHVQNNAVIIL